MIYDTHLATNIDATCTDISFDENFIFEDVNIKDFELKIEGDDDLSRDSSETNDSKNDFRITKLDDAYDYPEINSRNKSYAPASYHKDFRSDVKAKIERDPEFLT